MHIVNFVHDLYLTHAATQARTSTDFTIAEKPLTLPPVKPDIAGRQIQNLIPLLFKADRN